ncbi:dicarboxylate/amino acid:cation symporter [Psychrobacillus psychrodurans]|uniref:Dicarboxylate/amino acid:cation symporter n=1 Tax=Psychrobacillus psychrodurans TaxID=126157 RepID=A0A9X3LC56_9BACI|nr:dicarboxylate/amino acid:cation symporter [Psychrobacillus psychrodurans]MCZ8535238.1 dicarboxylate/amino acid:cation symporter [Psychrobacillus psychrodurans]
MKRFGLLPRIVIAIVSGVLLGLVVPKIVVEIMATFNSIFSAFLGFIVPFIIIGFIVPGIAKLGKGSGRLLGISTGIAYLSTIVAGLIAFFVASNLLPNLIGGKESVKLENPEEFLIRGLFEMPIPPMMDIMTALVFSFIMGIGISKLKGNTLQNAFEEFSEIIEKVISYVIIPLLPIHIFGIFMNMAYGGQVAKVLSVFGVVFVMIIALHLVMLLLQYTAAGTVTGKNPLKLLKTMSPAYFTALGTQSSAATIPVTLKQTQKTGASDKVTNFTIPLFATIHLSGSTITLVSCSIGVLLINGQDIMLSTFVPFIFMLGVTMIAAPGVPGGAVMAALGLLETMLGFNGAMIGLMIALYIAQDSFGTATNVTGDGALAIIVDKFSKTA